MKTKRDLIDWIKTNNHGQSYLWFYMNVPEDLEELLMKYKDELFKNEQTRKRT